LLSIGSNTVTLGTATTTGTLTSRASGSTGTISGKFKRYLASGTNSYDFFVGPSTSHLFDANLTFSSGVVTGKTITVEWKSDIIQYGPGNLIDSNSGNKICNRSASHAWDITRDFSTDINYDLTLQLDNLYGTISETQSCYCQLRVIRRNDGTSTWDNKIPGYHFDATYDASKYFIAKRTGLTTFSQYSIAGSTDDGNFLNGPLPVFLSSFASSVHNKNVSLTWTSTMEINNSGFDIERKLIDGNWTKVGFVKGNGNSNTPKTYTFDDRNLSSGKYNYRLKQIDNNGNFEYHALQGFVEVGVPNKFEMSQNYPNPFNPVTKIDFEVPENGMVSIKIYDMLGKEVKTLVNEMKQAGYHTVELNAGNISSGTYFYRMTAGKFVKTLKMVVVK
jgi:hypothetical protein